MKAKIIVQNGEVKDIYLDREAAKRMGRSDFDIVDAGPEDTAESIGSEQCTEGMKRVGEPIIRRPGQKSAIREILFDGNLFTLPCPEGRTACLVTTNGMTKGDGKAVMGAGIAKYCRDTFPGVDVVLGDSLKKHGNHVHRLGWQITPGKQNTEFLLYSFPTKNDWKDPSDTGLIRQSCKEIVEIADELHLDTIYMPCPGCSNGCLDYAKDVRGILLEELDGRFTVCVPSRIWKTVDWEDGQPYAYCPGQKK